MLKGILLFLFLAASLQAEEWVKVTIKKAFISRQTFEANRDIFTEPEFGWRVLSNKQVIMRGDLYGDYFLPKSKDMELALIEKDIISDDLVQTFPLDAAPGIKRFENGEDEFSIDVGPFFPNAKSGSDQTMPQAIPIGGFVQDSVSFRDQDMTDSFLVETRLTLFAPEFPFIQIAAPGCKLVSDIHQNFVVLDCPPGKHSISVVASPGSFATKYSLTSATDIPSLVKSVDRALDKRLYRYDSAFLLLQSVDGGLSRDFCKVSAAVSICAYSNYRLADPETRAKLDSAATTEELKGVLERARLDTPQE
ncbi:MAG: hypothetical protein K8S54_00785 [Spirochaetia bacterium]|nr:hypothetical protein [Spirochaetia bacterium]